MTRPELTCADFFTRYKGLVGAAASFALADGHPPEDFVLLLLARTDFIPGCLGPALAYASRPAGLGLALKVTDAQRVLRGKTLPADMSFAGGDGAFERCAAALDDSPGPGCSWLVVYAGGEIELVTVSHRDDDLARASIESLLRRVSARGGDA